MNIGDLIKTITGSELGIIISEIDMSLFVNLPQDLLEFSDVNARVDDISLYYKVYNFNKKRTILYGSKELKVFKKAPASNI